MPRVTIGVARLGTLTAQWPWVPGIGQNLMPYTGDSDVSICEKFSSGTWNHKLTNKSRPLKTSKTITCAILHVKSHQKRDYCITWQKA